ncbi:MAG: glycoside hydrolase family 68 protein [Porphyrobacter sp.]|nr:glycoside hydrolase family 68 protein [Porphyrobacter sp.]
MRRRGGRLGDRLRGVALEQGEQEVLSEQSSGKPATLARSPTLTRWTSEQVQSIRLDDTNTARLIAAGDFTRDELIDFWDAWPVQNADGHPARIEADVTLWMALAAPHFSDPDIRHGHARIHLLERRGDEWMHLGPVMPDGFSPGSREWSGSAVLAPDKQNLTLYFTAAGRRGEVEPTFGQRLFLAKAKLEAGANGSAFTDWHGLTEIVSHKSSYYMDTETVGCGPGTIKAFRDPAFFRDPLDAHHYLFFAASEANSTSAFNGVVGWAIEQAPGCWTVLSPVVSADGLNNELERPHVVFHDDAYYLFWSTQRHVFDPAGPGGPTGLYGMVSDRLGCGWRPLNGTGLVFANPPEAPSQAYSWLVLPDLSVISFVDDWGPVSEGRTRRFGASFAPELRLELNGATARLVR